VWGGESAADEAVDVGLFQPGLLTAAALITPLLVIAASWLPAVVAATQDPAVVLREE
jgi:ABC-type lipoprotein release transport system permease subunit